MAHAHAGRAFSRAALALDYNYYSLTLLGALAGLFSGLVIKLYKEVLECFLQIIWWDFPSALYHAGWTNESPFGLFNLTWLLGAFFGLLVGLLRSQLPPDAVTSMSIWVRDLHGPQGAALPGRWVILLMVLSLLTAMAGASVGPEPVVIIMPSVLFTGLVQRFLQPSAPALRVAALAAGAGGLAAFFGLPLASAFFALEIPHMDGAEYALEAYPACVMAGLVGTIVGHCIWHPDELLGNSRFWFPGGRAPGEPELPSVFGMGAVAMAPLAGLVGGCSALLLVALMKGWHPLFEHVKKHHSLKPLRYGALLAVVGAANAAFGLLYPSALWWGEEQLQVALTRGCSHAAKIFPDCEPFPLPYLYPKMIRADAITAHSGISMSGWEMLGLGIAKLVMISMCEGAGFVGGPIYPIIFASSSLGSALGATDWIALLGGQYVYICTAAAMSTALSGLLHTQLFGILIVMELQANIPSGSVSSQTIALTVAVYSFYLLTRTHVAPHFRLIAAQKPRDDVRYLDLSLEPPESETGSEEDVTRHDTEMVTTLTETTDTESERSQEKPEEIGV